KEIEKELGTDNARENYLALIHNSKSAIPQQDHPRLGFVSDSLEEAQKFIQDSIKLLEKQPDADAWDHPRGITFRSRGITPEEKVIALFPGQGSQYLNMASELAINFPPVMEAFELMDQLFLEQGQTPLSRVVYPPPVFSDQDREKQQLQLRETDYAQAGIGVVSYGIFKILERAGFEPDITAGHSFGELTALWAGGSLNDQEFLRLVKARGSAMRPPNEKDFDTGTMAAVKGPLPEIKKIIEPLEDVIIANENSSSQVVLAGPREKINGADKVLTEAGYKVTQLPVSAAFHTPLVEHASKPFAEAVNKEKFNKSNIPVYSNTTGKPYPADTKKAQKILSDHILHPVIFKTQIEEIYKNGGRVFVEIGPRQILGSLVKDILDGQPHSVVSVNPSRDKSSDRQLREAAVVLKVLGLPLKDIDPYQTNAKRKEVQDQDQ
ncbi:MAG: acyltransferase domain-containing protein, partial [Anaerolineales bacterium]|nr:acyltransferase domain-containing protein [Anaerolineales bacterium]